MGDSVLALRTESDLATAAAERAGMRRRRFERIAIEVDRLEPGRRTDLERRLNRAYRACGCELGAAATVAALVGCMAYAMLGGTITRENAIRVGALGSLIVVLAALVGKAAGLWLARRRLNATLAELQAEMRHT